MTKDKKLIKDFVEYCKRELNIQTLPNIKLIADTNWVAERYSFGEYSPSDATVYVYYRNRCTADVFRSLAHELTHHRQGELNMIQHNSGETGTDIENDANAMAGIIMRDYGKLKPEIYDLEQPTRNPEQLQEAKKQTIRYTMPNFEKEWGEATRYPKLFPDKKTWLEKASTGKENFVDCTMNIQNTDMCNGNLEDLDPQRVARAKQAVKKGVVELPIVLKLKDKYELLGGNTRLTALISSGLPAKAWIIDLTK